MTGTANSLRAVAVTIAAALALLVLALAATAPNAEARLCSPMVGSAYQVTANGHVSCAKARKVVRKSFRKITVCIERGRCRAAGFRCRPRMAKNVPANLSGGKMTCRRGKGRVTYGFGG